MCFYALQANITTLGPLVLPFSEQLLFLLNLVHRKVAKALKGNKVKPYIPDFKLAFDHVCIHTGGAHKSGDMLRLISSVMASCSATDCRRTFIWK